MSSTGVVVVGMIAGLSPPAGGRLYRGAGGAVHHLGGAGIARDTVAPLLGEAADEVAQHRAHCD